MRRIKAVLLYVCLTVAILGLTIIVSKDPMVSRFTQRAEQSARPAPSASPPQVAPQVAPSSAAAYAQAYADAFCRQDAAYLAAHTQIVGVHEQIIADYLSADPRCAGARFLGELNDDGEYRYIFVLDFGARQDWLVLTAIHDDRTMLVINVRRG